MIAPVPEKSSLIGNLSEARSELLYSTSGYRVVIKTYQKLHG